MHRGLKFICPGPFFPFGKWDRCKVLDYGLNGKFGISEPPFLYFMKGPPPHLGLLSTSKRAPLAHCLRSELRSATNDVLGLS